MHRYTVLFEDRQAKRIDQLAGQYGLTEQEVLRQLVELGLEHTDAEWGEESSTTETPLRSDDDTGPTDDTRRERE